MTYTGLRRTFMGDLDVHQLGPAGQHAIEVVGAIGHLARAIALAVVGLLAGRRRCSPTRPGRWAGHGAAALGSTGLGASLLVVVAAGFAAFGLFCWADAATRRA